MWDKLKEQFNLLKLEKKKLCLITNSDKFVSKNEFVDAVASALQGGVDMVLLNEPNIPDGVVVDIGRKIRILCDEYGATFIVNSRPDIAMLTEADGVHLEPDGISIADAREIMPHNAIVGKSATTMNEAMAAADADYIILTPLQSNETLVAPDLAADVIKEVKIPVFVAGDITPANLNEFLSFGVNKIAVCDPLIYARIPEITAREYMKYL